MRSCTVAGTHRTANDPFTCEDPLPQGNDRILSQGWYAVEFHWNSAAKLSRRNLGMRRWICAALLLGCVACSGCALPIYSAIPERRAEQLVYTSENLRLLLQEWERFWMVDQPDHMTPYRVHGGVI